MQSTFVIICTYVYVYTKRKGSFRTVHIKKIRKSPKSNSYLSRFTKLISFNDNKTLITKPGKYQSIPLTLYAVMFSSWYHQQVLRNAGRTFNLRHAYSIRVLIMAKTGLWQGDRQLFEVFLFSLTRAVIRAETISSAKKKS